MKDISDSNVSFLIHNMKRLRALDRHIGEAFIEQINNKHNEIQPRNVAVALKTLNELPFMRKALSERVNWSPIEDYFYKQIKIDNNMNLLYTLSFLDDYFSKDLLRKLHRATINRLINETKMNFYQIRYVVVNLTTLAKLIQCKHYNQEEKD